MDRLPSRVEFFVASRTCLCNACCGFLWCHFVVERGNIDFYSWDVVDSKPSQPGDFFGGTDVSFGPLVAEMLHRG